jgi:hypothetical protein
VIRLTSFQRYAYEAEDVKRYNNMRNEVRLQVEDSGNTRLASDILEQFFDLGNCVPATRTESEKGEGSVWVGGFSMD